LLSNLIDNENEISDDESQDEMKEEDNEYEEYQYD